MKIILSALALTALFAMFAFAASGDKPNQVKLQFRNISTATKPACVKGELKSNNNYAFICMSTSGKRGKGWRRIDFHSYTTLGAMP